MPDATLERPPRADICLVQMPYAALERPSMALGVLKALLNPTGIRATVAYPNLRFAEAIGLDAYWSLAVGSLEELLGEWTFAAAAFPDFDSDDARYLELAERTLSVTYGYKRLQKLRRASTLSGAFQEIRDQAAGFVDQVARELLEQEPRIVGCSSTFQQHCASLALLRRVKELDPSVVTLLGGANTDSSMGVVSWAAFPWLDVVVSGEAEAIFVDLCLKLLEQGPELEADALPAGVLAGQRMPARIKALLESPPRALLQDLDLSPPPDYDDYFQALAASPIGPYVRPTINIETSRGCWWGAKRHCSFCGLNGNGMSYRSKSPARALEEFHALAERYARNNFFTVDNILDMRYFDELLPQLEASPRPFSIFYEIKANLKREQVRQLARSGVRWIQPGLESMHDDVLRRLDKGNTTLINVQLLKWAAEFGIFAAWHFLYGVPGEDDAWYAEMAEWLPQVYHLQPPTGLSRIQFERFSPYHQRPADYGLSLRPHSAYAHVYPLEPELLAGLAYYFEPVEEDTSPRPGFARLHSVVSEWKRRWFLGQAGRAAPVELALREDGAALRIRDTRPIAVQAEIELTGLARRVFEACDRAATAAAIEARLGLEPDQTAAPLAELTRLKLLLHRKGRYLSLAVPEERPGFEAQYAGGEVYVDRWVARERQLERLARATRQDAVAAFTGRPG